MVTVVEQLVQAASAPLRSWAQVHAARIAAVVMETRAGTLDPELPPEAPDMFGGRDVVEMRLDEVARIVCDHVEQWFKHGFPHLPPGLVKYALAVDGPMAAYWVAFGEGAGEYANRAAKEEGARRWAPAVKFGEIAQQAWANASKGADLFGSVEGVNHALAQYGPLQYKGDRGVLRVEARKARFGPGYDVGVMLAGHSVSTGNEKTRTASLQAAILSPRLGQALAASWLADAGWKPPEIAELRTRQSSGAAGRHATRQVKQDAAQAAWSATYEVVRERRRAKAARWVKRTRALLKALREYGKPLTSLRDLKAAIPRGYEADSRSDSSGFAGTTRRKIAYSVDGPAEPDLRVEDAQEPPSFRWSNYGKPDAETSLNELVRDLEYKLGKWPDVETLVKALDTERNMHLLPYAPERYPDPPHRTNRKRRYAPLIR